MSQLPTEMKAVVFRAPFDVQVESKPVPKIDLPTDAIIKVEYAGLCGSDMHTYRGHIKGKPGTVVGHEFTELLWKWARMSPNSSPVTIS